MRPWLLKPEGEEIGFLYDGTSVVAVSDLPLEHAAPRIARARAIHLLQPDGNRQPPSRLDGIFDA